MQAAYKIMAGLSEPSLGITLAVEHLEASLSGTIDIARLPADEARGELALANSCHGGS
jgi:hypothetical protein